MDKYDVKAAHKALYSPPTNDFVIVDMPPMNYLAVDGHGDPNTAAEYAEAVEALYSVSYAAKFHSKKELDRDFVVAPLEGLWRADDPAAFTARAKSEWRWTMMINQPKWITEQLIEATREKVAAKKPLPALPKLRLLTLHEGVAVQIMHVGSYDDEAPTLARLHDEYMPAHGFAFNGDHHEIYLGDPRRTAPEKLKTILRQPVLAVSAGQ